MIERIVSASGLDNVVGNLLAVLISVALLALVFYTIVALDDKDLITATLSFSLAILGVILGYYFNKGQVSRVMAERDDSAVRLEETGLTYDGLEQKYNELLREFERVLGEMEEE